MVIRSRTSSFQNSFVLKTIQDWNALDNDIKASGTIETFVKKLNAPPRDIPKWYYSGLRSLSVKHARLRMLCSPLNDHLYSHIHVIENPSCICGHLRENNKHYLFECPLYANERAAMLNDLLQIDFQPTLNNILFGNKKYSEDINKKAFRIIQHFIFVTGRLE